jgi:hypothetical protein
LGAISYQTQPPPNWKSLFYFAHILKQQRNQAHWVPGVRRHQWSWTCSIKLIASRRKFWKRREFLFSRQLELAAKDFRGEPKCI